MDSFTVRTYFPPVKVYLSYPMTKASEEDRRLRQKVRDVLKGFGPRIDLYDPEKDEPEAALADLQQLDYEKLSASKLVIFVLGPGTDTSKGQQAEMEWVVRCGRDPAQKGVCVGAKGWLKGWTLATAERMPLLSHAYALEGWLHGYLDACQVLSVKSVNPAQPLPAPPNTWIDKQPFDLYD